jgi:hypothetical protein
MIKKLLLTAALLAPGLAYARSALRWAPRCSDYAAGFTILALNADFSQPSYTNLANWLYGSGGSLPGWTWVAAPQASQPAPRRPSGNLRCLF